MFNLHCNCHFLNSIGTVHAGIGPTHVNAFLTSMNIPPIAHTTLNRRQMEAGLKIESVAKQSCITSTSFERDMQMKADGSCDLESENKNTAQVNLTVSYDMGWQKRGRAHNSLTGLFLHIRECM